MLSLGSDRRTWPTALAAAAGTASYAMPLIVPWHAGLVFVASFAGLALMTTTLARVIWGLTSTLVLVAVVSGYMSSSLGVAAVSVAALLVSAAPSLAVAIPVLNLSITATIQEVIANELHRLNIEAAGPAIVAILILTLLRPSFLLYAALFLAAALVSTFVGNYFVGIAEVGFVISSMWACLFATLVAKRRGTVERVPLALLAALSIGMTSWAATPPRMPTAAYGKSVV